MNYSKGPQNIITEEYQVIRLSEGCPNMPAFETMIPIEKIFVNLGPDRHIRCLNIYRIKKDQSSKLSDYETDQSQQKRT